MSGQVYSLTDPEVVNDLPLNLAICWEPSVPDSPTEEQQSGETSNQQVTENELAWLAGFFDAEGSVFVTKQYDHGKREKERLKGNVSLINRGKHVMATAIEIMDRMGTRPYVYEEKGGKYTRAILGSKAKIIRFLEQIEPLLSGKRAEAQHMIRWLRDGNDQSKYILRKRECRDDLLVDIGDLISPWIAGFIDGDGCITIRQHKKLDGSIAYAPLIAFSNNDKMGLDRIRMYLDKLCLRYSENTNKYNVTHVHVVEKNSCERILRDVEIYLVEKKPQASILRRYLHGENKASCKLDMRKEILRYESGTPETKCQTSNDEDIVHSNC